MLIVEVQERVAAGLRAVKRAPVALLFIDDVVDWTWDGTNRTTRCCGVTVYHTSDLVCGRWGSHDICPFVPLWAEDYPGAMQDVRRFQEAYVNE